MGELVEHANFGERVDAIVETFAENPDPLRVEPVEAANRIDA